MDELMDEDFENGAPAAELADRKEGVVVDGRYSGSPPKAADAAPASSEHKVLEAQGLVRTLHGEDGWGYDIWPLGVASGEREVHEVLVSI
ncbi:hypothetical protein LTR85_004613 [Meristemomyces frigidus]|nr:hypothetical protein LTR85_004613 [Meristemomyces frigidus]